MKNVLQKFNNPSCIDLFLETQMFSKEWYTCKDWYTFNKF